MPIQRDPQAESAIPVSDSELSALRARMLGRFGLVPSFFMMARAESPIVAALLSMAEFAYFDSPLPALFKERLFTYVSRFCPVPYCMARHCGFLLGLGNVAGQPSVAGISVEEAVATLSIPFPDGETRAKLLTTLRDVPGPLTEFPEPRSALEDTLFFAAAVVFVMPREHGALLRELERVLGPRQHQYLMLFLAFIRFAHYWTETHPELRLEDDLEQLLAEQRALATWMSRYPELVERELGQQVQAELRELETLRVHARALESDAAALQRLVQARTLEATAATRAKAGFLATVSHELRTPLNAILGYSDLLEAGAAGPLGEQVATYVTRIKATARHQQQIIEEILAFSRLEAGRETVHIASVALAEIRDEIHAIIAPLAHERGLTFAADFTLAPAVVRTDPRKLRQILLNLLGNAVKFTPAGSVALSVRCSDGTIAFAVSDSGPGISPEDRERIFEPFTQLDESATRIHGGTGLGLAITRRLVGLLDGTIALDSAIGRGTTFTVALPLELPA